MAIIRRTVVLLVALGPVFASFSAGVRTEKRELAPPGRGEARALAESIIYVDDTATGANDGSSWPNAYRYLRDALADAAVSGKDVWVAAGTYTPNSKRCTVDGDCNGPGGGTCPAGECVWASPREQTFQLLDGIALYGGFAGGESSLGQRNIQANETILSGDVNRDDGPQDCAEHSDCCRAHEGFGCDSAACESLVCQSDPNCCDPGGWRKSWDRDCASYAARQCCDLGSWNSCENSYHVVTASDTDAMAALDGFTITAGNAGNPSADFSRTHGGGMFSYESSMARVTNCTFRENSSLGGGSGMFLYRGSDLRLTECTFTRNRNDGMEIDGSSPTLSRCTFIRNTGRGLGGSGSPTLLDCAFIENASLEGGGGMSIGGIGGSPLLVNCTFTGNVAAGYGRGVTVGTGSSPTFVNCSFTGNQTRGERGGGLDNEYPSSTVINCTFLGNSAQVGGGVFSIGGNPTLTNCILAGNTAINGPEIGLWNGATATVRYSNVQGGSASVDVDAGSTLVWGEGNINVNPLLRPDHRPQPGSPCIDSGDNAAVPADTLDLDGDGDTAEPIPFDLAGNSRFLNDSCATDSGNGIAPIVDMGAFEAGDASCADDGDCDGGLFCNGVETCTDSCCTVSTPAPDCNDNSICTVDSCDEATQACVHVPTGIRYVNADAGNGGDGKTWETAFNDLREALLRLQLTDRCIWVASANQHPYTPAPPESDRTAYFNIYYDLALYGGFVGGETSLDQRDPVANVTILSGDLNGDDVAVSCAQDSPDCDSFGGKCIDGSCIIRQNNGENSYHVIDIGRSEQQTRLDGFTITAGNATAVDSGGVCGGMNLSGSGTPTIANCIFTGNTAVFGGGACVGGSNVTLTNCTFAGNSAGAGGGMLIMGASPTLINCRFIDNHATNIGVGGGAIYNNDGRPHSDRLCLQQQFDRRAWWRDT
jgi:parallel beta-helix repeat protein